MTVVVRDREEDLRLALEEGLALAEIDHPQHQRVGIGAQPADPPSPDPERGGAVRGSDLDAGEAKPDRDDQVGMRRAYVAEVGGRRSACPR